ncbi:MAG: transglutaminase domain-containing protein [Candidatus Aenigmatarchaeota archaeon]
MVLVFAAGLFFSVPLQFTGQMAARGSEKADVSGGEQAQEPEIIFTTFDTEQCRSELTVCENSVDELKSIVLDKCEKPQHDFEMSAWEVARSGVYDEDGFNCLDFSGLLVEKLENMGYNARIAHGYYNGEPHAWVVAEIPIESTSGRLITPQQYAGYVEKE